jgi:RNA polymerase sigma factor (sigma-70 family)
MKGLSPKEEQLLVLRCLNGEAEAQQQLHDQYIFWIRACVGKFARQMPIWFDIEDSIQEGYLVILQQLHVWDIKKGRLTTFIKSTLLFYLRNRYQRNKYKADPVCISSQYTYSHSPIEEDIETKSGALLDELYKFAVNLKREKDRDLILNLLEGNSIQHIADSRGVTNQAISRRKVQLINQFKQSEGYGIYLEVLGE